MNPLHQFEFLVDKNANSIQVSRDFNAPLELVWQAWTNPEILDQWWAPKPYRTKTKSMTFEPGGTWLYAMISPQNETHWCKAVYHAINHQQSYSYTDNFCDENGLVTEEFPNSLWQTSFTSLPNSATRVNIHIQYKSLDDLEKVVHVGFKEGFSMAMENLESYLEEKFRLWALNKSSKQPRVCTYLNFDGKTEEAFLFYKKVFKTNFIGKGIQRFGDIPPSPDAPVLADSIKQMILHVELPITGNHILMGTDAPKEMGFTLKKGNNMHICIEPESREEADRLFSELSNGGEITMPMADMFFGAYFGEFSDQYGINWMINYQNRQD